MEVIIFKKGEITQDLFNNERVFEINAITGIKNELFGNYHDLDKAKCLIDTLDRYSEKLRRAAVKFLHEYELVKAICKKQVISRAYFKLYEIVYHDQIMLLENLDCFFICEAPGGFIECVNDIRRKKNLRTKYFSVSKLDPYIKYDHYLENNNFVYEDIIENVQKVISESKQRFPNGFDLITADGGFDVKDFNAQEILTSKLLLFEIYIALKTQKIGGNFVIKFFDMFTHNTNIFYLLLCSTYNYVKIIKPNTSRNCNSERYIVCYCFQGLGSNMDSIFLELLGNYFITDSEYTKIFPDLNLSFFSNKISSFNNLILHEQIKTINESIKMVHNKDSYFQNLLLSIFLEKKNNINLNITFFKNILWSKIKKCRDFLHSMNININGLMYKLSTDIYSHDP